MATAAGWSSCSTLLLLLLQLLVLLLPPRQLVHVCTALIFL
jgi:hypothetical protein